MSGMFWLELPSGEFINLARIVRVEFASDGRAACTFTNEASDHQYPSGFFWVSAADTPTLKTALLAQKCLSGGAE